MTHHGAVDQTPRALSRPQRGGISPNKLFELDPGNRQLQLPGVFWPEPNVRQSSGAPAAADRGSHGSSPDPGYSRPEMAPKWSDLGPPTSGQVHWPDGGQPRMMNLDPFVLDTPVALLLCSQHQAYTVPTRRELARATESCVCTPRWKHARSK